ncbi:MAG: hypothetical protein ACNA7Y_01770 [Gammaproteobacteria bacterium]
MRITDQTTSDVAVLEKPETGDIFSTPAFNNANWRKLLSQVCEDIDVYNAGIQAINPFGFEILEDKKFLAGNLRRFYCYIGAPAHLNLDGDFIVSQYREALFVRLQAMETTMYEDAVIVVENQRLYKLKNENYICKPTDKLIDIQFRPFKEDILSDYANYIIASMDSLYSDKGEAKGYRNSRMHRWRAYQLYIIQETLFGNLIIQMNDDQHILYRNLFKQISNMIQIFYTPELADCLPSGIEEDIINKLIIPRISLMKESVSGSKNSQKINVECYAYHFEDKLEVLFDKNIYLDALNKIKNSYLNFI